MARQRWLTTAGMLGLLVAARVGWADEAAAVKAIQELGGRVEVDDALPGKPVVEVNFFGTKATDPVLKELKEFKTLQTLLLRGTKVTAVGIKELNTALRMLRIFSDVK